jgi:hypothetical protein
MNYGVAALRREQGTPSHGHGAHWCALALLALLALALMCVFGASARAAGERKNSGANNPVPIPPEKANPVRITKFDKPPVIDGTLDDEAWKTAAVLKDFYQIQPGDNIPPTKPTEVLLGYDEKNWYIAYRAFDEKGDVRATVCKRDNIWGDDNVGMFIDTFNDKRRAYSLFFNPLGIQADGTISDNGNEDYSLDIVMESKGTLNDDGYTVEIAIPFKSLRYEAGKDKLWGALFFRRIKRFNNELSSWMPLSRDGQSWLAQTGHLTGLEGISTEHTLEIIPSLTLSETGRTAPHWFGPGQNPLPGDPGRLLNQPVGFDPGLTVKYGITPTITLDFTANPDFAQVEADAPVVTANQRFPIFYDEKRPFFLEGIDIFQTALRPVHTRTIIDPDVAVKLTGKTGRNTFGLMLASDAGPGSFSADEAADPVYAPFVEKNAYVGVLRLKRDVGAESNVGMIATTYNFPERHNQLVGFDGRFKLDKLTSLDLQVLGTASRQYFFDPASNGDVYRNGNGIGYFAILSKFGRHFGYELSGIGRTRDYRARVGFTPRTNTNSNGLFLRWGSDPNPKGKILSWNVNTFMHVDYDFQGRSQSVEAEYHWNVQLPRQVFFSLGYERGYERLFEEEFGAKRGATQMGAFFGSDPERSSTKNHYYAVIDAAPTKVFGGFAALELRKGHFDYDFGAGSRFPRVSPAALADPNAALDPGRGDLLEVNSGIYYQPTDALRTSFDYTRSQLRRYDTDRFAYVDNIFSSRTTYQFTRFLFARARIDYDTLASQVFGQFLFGWTPNPGTSFYVGYNDDSNYNGFNRYTGAHEPGFRRNGRVFFVKMSYLFRYSL